MNDLQERQACRALPTEEALRYAAGLADLLRRMHRDGTVCGHLDPKDIVWDNLSVKLVPTDGAASGAYLAPEQVRGETADSRSDIFAFGAVLYELLAGRRAFPALDPEELKQQILQAAPPLEGLPEGVLSLLSGCLEKDRGRRFQRMNSVMIELQLANASARQAQSATERRDKVLSLRLKVAMHDEQLAAQQSVHETMSAELRGSIRRVETTLEAIHQSVAGLQKSSQVQTKAIDGLQVTASRTDEVVEDVVEALGRMHKSLLEREDAKVLLVAKNGA